MKLFLVDYNTGYIFPADVKREPIRVLTLKVVNSFAENLFHSEYNIRKDNYFTNFSLESEINLTFLQSCKVIEHMMLD